MGRQSKIYEDLNHSIVLNIKTKCPEKWLLIDRETGEIYQGNSGGYWDRFNVYKKELDNE
jgi:hypothetical protein